MWVLNCRRLRVCPHTQMQKARGETTPHQQRAFPLSSGRQLDSLMERARYPIYYTRIWMYTQL